jgi:hypothetical protein
MTTDRDPILQSLFAIAKQDPVGDTFTDNVMSRIAKLRRRVLIGWVCAGLVSAAFAWLLTEPVLQTVDLVTQLLPESLFELEKPTVAQFLAPVNSIAGVVALGLLGLRLAYKKIFS